MVEKTTMRALIADDHTLYRCGLALLLKDELGFSEVVEASTLDEALEWLEQIAIFDVALFDLMMPGMRGGACYRELRAQYPDTKFAIISASEEKTDILAALDGGFNGFLPKTLSNVQAIGAIRDILDGRIYVPSLIAKLQSKSAGVADSALQNGTDLLSLKKVRSLVQLTPRQRAVFELVRQGMTNKEIAEKLQIAEGTVKVHISTMLTIFNLRNRTEFLLLR